MVFSRSLRGKNNEKDVLIITTLDELIKSLPAIPFLFVSSGFSGSRLIS